MTAIVFWMFRYTKQQMNAHFMILFFYPHEIALYIPLMLDAFYCNQTSHEGKHMLILLVHHFSAITSLMTVPSEAQECPIDGWGSYHQGQL